MEKERKRLDTLETILAIAVALMIGFALGLAVPDKGFKKLEMAQIELRLDVNKIKQKAELAKIIDNIFRERNRAIDWNRNHIITLTVEPMPDAEEN